jgi:hypothetical protein
MCWSGLKDPDLEKEGVEPFQSKSGSDSFGAKVACHFEGLDLWVLITHLFDPNLKSISQCDEMTKINDIFH